jgi:hypothetical protein
MERVQPDSQSSLEPVAFVFLGLKHGNISHESLHQLPNKNSSTDEVLNKARNGTSITDHEGYDQSSWLSLSSNDCFAQQDLPRSSNNVIMPSFRTPVNACKFPTVLYFLLENAVEYSDIVSWQPHGRAFLVKDQQRFVGCIMHQYFRQTR